MSHGRQDTLNNQLEQLADKKNQLPENNWFNEINTSDYQAIIPLPYFHVGSENIWIITESNIIKDAFIASLKTGLPITSLILSRVSLGETYRNIQLVKEPYRPLEILNDFKNTKPFLVLVCENELNEYERQLLNNCNKIISTPLYSVYKLQIETLKHLSDKLYANTIKDLSQRKTFKIEQFESTDSLKTFIYDGYESYKNANSLMGKGCFEGKIKNYNVLYKGKIPNWTDQEYTLSFWMSDFTTDLYPRTTVELAYADSAGTIYGTDYFNPGKKLCVLDSSSALIESSFKLKEKTDQLIVTLWNDLIIDDKKIFRADELLIKPKTTTIYKNSNGQSITVNNRLYPIK
jgi:hypothetical protein